MTSTTISVVARVVGRDVSSAVGEGETTGCSVAAMRSFSGVCPFKTTDSRQSLSSTHFDKHTQCNDMKM